jgi:prolyl oligopeptidase
VKLNLPPKSGPVGIVDGRLLVALSQDWQSFKTDSVISYDLAEWKRDPNAAKPSLVWAPGARQTFGGAATTKDSLIVTTLDNVRGRAWEMNFQGGRWTTKPRCSASPIT